jgi:hypothetical protein
MLEARSLVAAAPEAAKVAFMGGSSPWPLAAAWPPASVWWDDHSGWSQSLGVAGAETVQGSRHPGDLLCERPKPDTSETGHSSADNG